jgi:aspartyl-tRNA(Asn)/glutamyl-tRNA(Gln) amidotransferase subunit A
MAATNQICQLDTITLARAVAAKELSPVEAVEAVLERLDRLDPTLHMFTTVVPDQARKDAKRIETDLAAGRDVGPLAGVPTGVKDLICTRGSVRPRDRMPTPTSCPTRTTSWWSGSRPLVRW